MFIAFDQVRAEHRDWDISIAAAMLGQALSKKLAGVPEQPLPAELTATLRLLDGANDQTYWRNYY